MTKFSVNDIAEILGRTPPFVGLTEAERISLARAGRVQTLKRDTVLFNKGDLADASHAVLSGCVALVLRTLDGRELVIGERRAGDFFGELAALTDQHRSTDAITTEPTELLSIPTSAFLYIIDSTPTFARQLLTVTAQRLRECSERESALAFLDAQGRLARMLLQLHRAAREGAITMPQEELAQHVGLTRQTVAKELGKWRRLGWLTTARNKIVLVNVPAIESFSAQFEP